MRGQKKWFLCTKGMCKTDMEFSGYKIFRYALCTFKIIIWKHYHLWIHKVVESLTKDLHK